MIKRERSEDLRTVEFRSKGCNTKRCGDCVGVSRLVILNLIISIMGVILKAFACKINFIKWSTTFIMQCKTILKVLMVCKVRLKVEETLCVCLCEKGSYIYI